MFRTSSFRVATVACIALALGTMSACSDDSPSGPPAITGFLAGANGSREIGIVVNSTGRSLTMFQLGSPTTTRTIALGTSSAITPTGLSVRGTKAVVPLGNAASVALVDLENAVVSRFFTFTSGNTTGSVWTNDTTVFAANTVTDRVGRFYTTQARTAITVTATVAPSPTAIAFTGGRVLVVSGNLANYVPIGNGIVTAIDPSTMTVLGTVQTGGTNPTDAAVGPDGLLYVVNTGDYVAQGSLTIINPATLSVVGTYPNMGVGAGAISIDANGLAYISGFYSATLVWNTKTRTFVRDASNPVCAKRAGTNECRGAFSAESNAGGRLYQLFFGSASQALPPYAFVYSPTSFALTDSVAVGTGPSSIVIRTF